MNEKERNEEARLSAIRQRARAIEQGAEGVEGAERAEGAEAAGGGRPAEPERPRRGPVVSAWRSAGSVRRQGPMTDAYPGMMGGYPGYAGGPTPVGMPFEAGHPGWSGRPREGRVSGESWSPRAHVYERGGNMVARVELPGLDRKDVEVHVEDDRIVVEGNRPDDRTPEERAQNRGEARYGPFRREFPLPYAADPSDVKARFRNGLLEVFVPQPSREERRKEIKVET